jgi:hypothetical protein
MKAKGRTVVVALVTVFAMSVVSVSAASATLPEFSRTKQTFTSTIIGGVILEAKNAGYPLDCEGGKTVGEIVNKTQVGKVVVTLTGCATGPEPCTTSGKSSGEVVTNTLKGELGEDSKTVVLGLEPEKAGEAILSCDVILNVTLKGGLIGKITPIGKNETTFKQVWEQTRGEQVYKSFEGSSTKSIRSLHLEYSSNGKTAVEAGVEGTEELTFKELVEIVP